MRWDGLFDQGRAATAEVAIAAVDDGNEVVTQEPITSGLGWMLLPPPLHCHSEEHWFARSGADRGKALIGEILKCDCAGRDSPDVPVFRDGGGEGERLANDHGASIGPHWSKSDCHSIQAARAERVLPLSVNTVPSGPITVGT